MSDERVNEEYEGVDVDAVARAIEQLESGPNPWADQDVLRQVIDRLTEYMIYAQDYVQVPGQGWVLLKERT